MSNMRQRFGHLRSILEIPLSSDRFWPKIPTTQADGIMLDLEDSVPPAQKAEARQKVQSICADQTIVGGKTIFVRVNGLTSEWGEADLLAMDACPSDIMISYPKIEHEAELGQALNLLKKSSATRNFYVMIESHAGLSRLEPIITHPNVVGVHFGYSDYALDVGCDLFNQEGDGFHGPAMHLPCAAIGAAAAAHGIFASGGTLIPDFRNQEKVGRFVQSWRSNGYSACIALMPAHVTAIHENIRHSSDNYARATRALEDSAGNVPFLERRLAQLTVKQHRGY
jgi:citrate lyase subunit beta/citryl-CoA lyase